MTLSYCIRPFLMTKIGKSNRRYKRTLKTQRILGGFLAVEVRQTAVNLCLSSKNDLSRHCRQRNDFTGNGWLSWL